MSITKKIAAAFLAGLLCTACGTTSQTGAESAELELEKITIGVLQVSASAPIPYGVQEGIFEKHGLDVEVADSQSEAAMLPAVEAGTFDIGVLSTITAIIDNERRLDNRILSGYASSYPHG